MLYRLAAAGTGNRIGQYRMDIIQLIALINTFGEIGSGRAANARAADQTTYLKIKLMMRARAQGFSGILFGPIFRTLYVRKIARL